MRVGKLYNSVDLALGNAGHEGLIDQLPLAPLIIRQVPKRELHKIFQRLLLHVVVHRLLARKTRVGLLDQKVGTATSGGARHAF